MLEHIPQGTDELEEAAEDNAGGYEDGPCGPHHPSVHLSAAEDHRERETERKRERESTTIRLNLRLTSPVRKLIFTWYRLIGVSLQKYMYKYRYDAGTHRSLL